MSTSLISAQRVSGGMRGKNEQQNWAMESTEIVRGVAHSKTVMTMMMMVEWR